MNMPAPRTTGPITSPQVCTDECHLAAPGANVAIRQRHPTVPTPAALEWHSQAAVSMRKPHACCNTPSTCENSAPAMFALPDLASPNA